MKLNQIKEICSKFEANMFCHFAFVLLKTTYKVKMEISVNVRQNISYKYTKSSKKTFSLGIFGADSLHFPCAAVEFFI